MTGIYLLLTVTQVFVLQSRTDCDSLVQLMQFKEIVSEGFAVIRAGYQRQMTYSVVCDVKPL